MICSKCKKDKDINLFYERKWRKKKMCSWCMDCLKEYRNLYKERNKITRRMREFWLSNDEYLYLYEKQWGACCICEKTEEDIQQHSLCVDHDHATGKIRGLLCHDCNVGIGRFKDNVELLKRAIKYLKQ